jgi:hypothetical protein
MSWRTTAVLFAVLLLLAGYVYWESRREATPAVEAPAAVAAVESVRLVTGVDAGDVRRLDVTRRADGLSVSFTRDQEGLWLQTVPTTTEVISHTMEFAAGNLVAVTSRRSFDPGSNPPAAYGLEEPAYQVVLAVADAGGRIVRYTFNLGDAVAGGDGRYVQVSGNQRVHIVPGYVFNSALDLLDNPPLPEPPEEEPSPEE